MSSNSPHSESGFTAVSSWLFACIMFVFSALAEYTMILYKLKNKTKVQFLYNLILYKLGFNLEYEKSSIVFFISNTFYKGI